MEKAKGMLAFATFVALACGALSAETISLWQGEKAYVWRDVTNGSPNLIVMKPSSPDAFVRTGVALPVRMENDRLMNDRVVWDGSVAVPPGGVGRIVAEIRVEEVVRGPARVLCNGETFEYDLDVAPRKFPAAKDRRTFLDVWQHPWAVARLNQAKPFSKKHYDCMRPLWRELADAGQKVITTTIMDQPWAHQCFDAYGTMVRHIRLDSGGWRFDYSVFDEYVAFAKSCGLGPQIHCYSLCPFRLKRYSWEDEKGHKFAGDFDIGSPEFIDYWTAFLNDFATHLKAKGWFEDVYIALDERSPEELNAAVALAKKNGAFKIALAADRPPSTFSGVDIGNFSIALQHLTDKYVAEAHARRKLGKTTTFYTAGSNPCTSLRNPPEYCQWLGAFAGAMDLDGYLRWAFCSWPANPDSDAVYHPWFGGWNNAGGTYLHYPKGPSLRWLGLRNGLNLCEKIKILRAEGNIGPELAGCLKEFRYPGGNRFPDAAAVADLLRRTAAAASAKGAHLYPQPAGEARNAAGYAVSVDGQPAGVAAVRNSAMPVNIRWPGHQREIDQTEIDGMVRFSAAGKAIIAVTAPRDFKEVKVRPYAKGVKAEVAGRTATFTIPGPGAYSVEFDGPHENLHVFADPPETLKAKPDEKGVRYFGPGEHDAGLITLKTDETLYIDEGAVVFGRIEARDADHIRILGRGILDMSRIKEQLVKIDPKLAEEQRKRGFAITNAKRWNAVKLEFCDDVLIDGITIRDSLLYNIRPIGCRGLTIRNVKICGNWRYNSDGIDMHNCENVRISDCFVRTFDDAICVKGFDYTMDESEMLHDGYHHNVFTNVVVERCTVWCDWGHCLEFGAETRAEEIRDVTWRDCDILHVHSAPLDVKNCDYADIHDVLFEDIRLEMDRPCAKTCLAASAKSFDPKALVGQPPAFSSAVRVIAEYSKNDKRRGKNRDIRLKDIRVTSPQMPRFTSRGYDAAHRSTGITVDGIYWNGREVSKEAAKGQSVGPFADPIRFGMCGDSPR